MEEKGLVMWLNITLNEESSKLDSRTIKHLTLVSRSIANALKRYVEQNYWFDLSSEYETRTRVTTHYSPANKKEVMDISEITPSTKRVVFHDKFNRGVNNLLLLQNLTSLEFSHYFNMPVDNLLPPHITHIVFGSCFNRKVDHLPPNLTHLTFGHQFTQHVDHLPSNLTHLKFTGWFNRKVDHLPSNLTHLTFEGDFNQPIDHLPHQLKNLTLSAHFNRSIDHLPPNLINLEFGACFTQRIESLPPKVEQVTFQNNYTQPIDHLLPILTKRLFFHPDKKWIYKPFL